MNWQDFIKSRWATWLLGAALLLVMVMTARVLIQKRKVDQQISQLQSQLDKIKNDNQQLSGLIQYFNTPDYQERQAREKLNLQKPGEVVVGLPQTNDVANQAQANTSTVSNLKQWLNYFFGNSK